MENDVFAYKIGENLFCPECIEEAEKRLPKDSKMQLPKKPLTVENIDIFICKECKKIFRRRSLIDVQDLLNYSICKINFVYEFFCHEISEDEYFGSQRSIDGLAFVLREIEEQIEQAVNDLNMIGLNDQKKEVEKNGCLQARG